MIYGIGTDIAKVSRFEKWINTEGMCERFFNEAEIKTKGNINALCEHYASRFAAKEAFVKALGTGFSGFDLKEIFVVKNEEGKPFLKIEGKAKELLQKRCGECRVHLSLSHEKEFAIAYVVIENK